MGFPLRTIVTGPLKCGLLPPAAGNAWKPYALAVLFCLLCCSSVRARSYALLVGVSYVEKATYAPRYYDNDATKGVASDMIYIQNRLTGVNDVRQLMDTKATVANILKELEAIGKQVKPGDDFLFYFSGHGDTITGPHAHLEVTGHDQALVTYSGYLIDDLIDEMLRKYFTKTRNVMIVDACHSATTYKYVGSALLDFMPNMALRASEKSLGFARERAAIGQFIDPRTCSYSASVPVDEPYSLIYLGATGDNAISGGFTAGGALTLALNSIYNNASGGRPADWRMLACRIAQILSDRQQLQYHEIGKEVTKYSKSAPFTF
jgi:hypothetical protein